VGEIIESRRRHYIGGDADKDSIPAAGKSFGDSYHANDKGKQYYWNGSAWKTGLGYEFVERLTNAPDRQVGDFITDGTFKVDGFSLAGIIPLGTIAVRLKFDVTDDAAGSSFLVRRDAVNIYNSAAVVTQVANIPRNAIRDISIDSDRLLDYLGSNLAFTLIDITVLGWYI